MVQNLTEDYTTDPEGANSRTDQFIDSMSIRLIGSGISTFAGRNVSSFLFPAFLIVYYRQGSTSLHCGDHTILLKPGSFYVFQPYRIYSGERVSREPLEFAFLQFDIAPYITRRSFCEALLNAEDEISGKYQGLGRRLDSLAGTSLRRDGREATLRQLAKYLTAQIIYDFLEQSDRKEVLPNAHESVLINRAFEYVAAHLSDPVMINEIVKYAATSKTSLDKAFRKVLNQTPQQAILQFKIERSLEMLQQDLSIKSISRELGFSSSYHFSNTFKKITGIRPTEYRESRDREIFR
jgi:AraC-like DNA-binding protein